MLEDLLEFAARTLVDDGRLSLWMPTANDEDGILGIPSHPYLDLVSVCVQTFNKCVYSALTQISADSTDDPSTRVQKATDVQETARLSDARKHHHETKECRKRRKRQRLELLSQAGKSFPPLPNTVSSSFVHANRSDQYFEGFKSPEANNRASQEHSFQTTIKGKK